MTINDNSTKSINAAIIDLQNQIKQLQHKIGILSNNQLKENDIEFPDKVEYADEAGKAKEADHAKTADTAKYTSETENAVRARYADNATKATQDVSGNVITDTYATKTELTSGLSGKADTSHNHSAADITSGTLAVERGGTGQTTQADINKAIVGELPEGNDVVTDGTMFVSSWASDNGFADTNATNVPYKRKFSLVWEYIKGKISSVLGITNNKHIIKGETLDTNTYEDANPKLVFINSDGSQNASLTFTDYDAVQAPASVTLNGNQGGEYFIAPNIKATGKFYGSLDGTADNATKATQDGSGNVITDTYATKTELTSGLSGKAAKSHTHTKSEITDFEHTHDDRYFTETEVTNKLAGKSDTGHTHTKSEITDFPTSLPASGGTADNATNVNLSKTLDTVNGDKLQIGSGAAQNVTNAKHAVTAEHAVTADNGVPTYSTSDAGKNLAVNSSGNAVGWVKPQTIKFVDYRTGELTFSSLTDQKRIELSNFGPEVTEDNVLNFMTIHWSGIHVIAQADWAKSQGTESAGMACALHSLNTGTGSAVIRCVYLA